MMLLNYAAKDGSANMRNVWNKYLLTALLSILGEMEVD